MTLGPLLTHRLISSVSILSAFVVQENSSSDPDAFVDSLQVQVNLVPGVSTAPVP